MSDGFNRIARLWNALKEGPAGIRACFKINRDHIDIGDAPGGRFKAGEHYFQVIINEMFLAHERQWFVTYDPIAFVASSYIYATKQETLPIVVGPAMLQQFGQAAPSSPIFRNIPVTGFHPYQGGALTLTLILSRLQHQNNAEKLLQVVENVSRAIDPSTALLAYLKIADTVLGGVQMLLGLQQTIPVVGYRTTINPDVIGQMFEPSYFALIDADDQQIKRGKFWVRDSHLCYGDTLETAVEYRDHDFILLNIAQGDRRSDEHILPFYPLWKTTQDLATHPSKHYWAEAKNEFNTLMRELFNSPDLTKPDMARLQAEYLATMEQRREAAKQAGKLAPGQLPDVEARLNQIATALDGLD